VPESKYDDMYILRFLRARQFNVEKAEAQFKGMLEYRKKYEVDTILETFRVNPVRICKCVQAAGAKHLLPRPSKSTSPGACFRKRL